MTTQPQAQRDPRTYEKKRVGLQGHPGFSRTKAFTLRSTETMAAAVWAHAKKKGFKNLNDFYNNLASREVNGAADGPDYLSAQNGAASPANLRHHSTLVLPVSEASEAHPLNDPGSTGGKEPGVLLSPLPEGNPQSSQGESTCHRRIDTSGNRGYGDRDGEIVSSSQDPLRRATTGDSNSSQVTASGIQQAQDLPKAPPRPVFWPRYEAGERSQQIGEARKSTWEEFPDELASIDDGTQHFSKTTLSDDNCMVDWYQRNLSILRSKREREQEEARERAEKEEALSQELSAPQPPTLAALLYKVLEPMVAKAFTLEAFAAELEAYGPIQTPEDFLGFEDYAIDKIEHAEIEEAKYEGGKVHALSNSGLGVRRVLDTVSLAGSAAQVKRVTAKHERARAQRDAFRAKRAGQLSSTEQRLVVAVSVLAPQLRQDGNPHDQRIYHEKEWREAAGSAARRLGSSTSMSTSSFETEGGATRPDRKALEGSFKRDSS